MWVSPRPELPPDPLGSTCDHSGVAAAMARQMQAILSIVISYGTMMVSFGSILMFWLEFLPLMNSL